jgi:hypothetical protein
MLHGPPAPQRTTLSPAGSGWHVPGCARKLSSQVSHGPEHSESQHTPLEQWPETQSASPQHLTPRGARQRPSSQLNPAPMHGVSAEQPVLHAVPSQGYGAHSLRIGPRLPHCPAPSGGVEISARLVGATNAPARMEPRSRTPPPRAVRAAGSAAGALQSTSAPRAMSSRAAAPVFPPRRASCQGRAGPRRREAPVTRTRNPRRGASGRAA